MVGWSIGGRVHMKSSARGVTHHPSATPVLSGLTLEVSIESGLSQLPVMFYTRAPLELHIIGEDPGEFKEYKNLQGNLARTFHKTPTNDAREQATGPFNCIDLQLMLKVCTPTSEYGELNSRLARCLKVLL
jgi:hypothetical protein